MLTSARVAAAVMMRAVFGDATPIPHSEGLAPHQEDAVARLHVLLQRYRGALLCDSVGLGKTHTAAAAMSRYAGIGPVLVTGPAQLKDHWRSHLRSMTGWRWISHTSLSRGRVPATSGFSLIVVDEAHAFRNPSTRRYQTLAHTIGSAHVLLLTATPVNNAPDDLYHLIRLFATDDTFIGAGVADLGGALESAREGDLAELRRVAAEIMVRRTRAMLRRQPDTPIAFPDSRGTELIRYAATTADTQRFVELAAAIASLSFAAHQVHGDDTASELMRLNLLKRLESGTAAFRASILRLVAVYSAFIDAAQAGLFFDARDDAHLVMPIDGTVQLAMQQIALDSWPSALDRTAALRSASRDVATLRSILRAVPDAANDAKLARLIELVTDELRDDRTVVFTEFRDTAEAVHRAFAPIARAALIHGGTARLGMRLSSRSAVIRRFAPGASPHRRLATPIDDVRVLVATDVLAEGMNLQDARVVISYDLPWNPVRLAQRAGRIDRMGSPHREIRIIAFAPGRGLERMMRLLRTIRRKIHVIRTLGGDTPPAFTRTATITAPAEEKEQARLEFLRLRSTLTPAPTQVPRAAMHADVDAPTTVCCVSNGLSARLLLVRADLRILDDDLLAWKLIRSALSCSRPMEAGLAVLKRAENLALNLDAQDAALSRPHPAAVRAAAAVRQWLATRPGTPSVAEIAAAEHALGLLRWPSVSIVTRLPELIRHGADNLVNALQGESATSPHVPGPPKIVASISFLPDPSRRPTGLTSRSARG